MKTLSVINNVIKIIPMSIIFNMMFIDPQATPTTMLLFLFCITYIGVNGFVNLIKELIK